MHGRAGRSTKSMRGVEVHYGELEGWVKRLMESGDVLCRGRKRGRWWVLEGRQKVDVGCDIKLGCVEGRWRGSLW